MKIGKVIVWLILGAGNGRRFIERGDLYTVREHFCAVMGFLRNEYHGSCNSWKISRTSHVNDSNPTKLASSTWDCICMCQQLPLHWRQALLSYSDSICCLGCLGKHQAGNLLLCCNPPAIMTLAPHYLLLWSPSLPFPLEVGYTTFFLGLFFYHFWSFYLGFVFVTMRIYVLSHWETHYSSKFCFHLPDNHVWSMWVLPILK